MSLELHQIRPNTRRGSPRNDDSAVSTPLNLGAQITAQQLAALPSRSFPEAGLLPDPPWPASRVSILVSAPTPAAGAFPPPPSSILAAFSRSAAVPARLPGRGGVLVGGPPRAATAHGAAVSGQARAIAPQRPRWGGAGGGRRLVVVVVVGFWCRRRVGSRGGGVVLLGGSCCGGAWWCGLSSVGCVEEALADVNMA